MPKASKTKKSKEADFKKVKTKLGKGKKVASSATDTSFKARSIALPNQNQLDRALADASEPVTSAGLTLEEVLLRLRHPNGAVRKEALGGIKEVLTGTPGREAGKVIRALGGIVADEDGNVRKALIGFLGWYLSANSVDTLSPHLPLLLLQTSSALSHIFPDIRLDACRLVHLLLAHVPSHVTGSWPHASSSSAGTAGGATILEGLRLAIGLGGDKGTNAQIGRLSPAAKLVTLKAMLAFIKASLRDGDEHEGHLPAGLFHGWLEHDEIERSAKSKGKQRAVEREPASNAIVEEGWLFGNVYREEVDGASWEIGRLEGDGAVSEAETVLETLAQLYLQLHSLLLSTFLESAPTAFSPSQTPLTPSMTGDTPLELCIVTASLTEVLVRPILSHPSDGGSSRSTIKEVRTSASDFLRRMSTYFPFDSRISAFTSSSNTGLPPNFELSLSYANLAILLSPAPIPLVLTHGQKRERGWKERVKAVEGAWKAMRGHARGGDQGKGKKVDGWAVEEVAEWMVGILSPPKDALAPPLTPVAYSALLPIALALITQPPNSGVPDSVLATFLDHLSRQPSSSSIRNIGDHFIMNLIMIHEQRFLHLPFFVPLDSEVRSMISDWAETLPKTLWQLKQRDQEASERILRFLLCVGSRGQASFEPPYSLVDQKLFPIVTARLVPFFHLTKPSVVGPWMRMNDQVKKLGLDVAAVWSEWDESGALGAAVKLAMGAKPGVARSPPM